MMYTVFILRVKSITGPHTWRARREHPRLAGGKETYTRDLSWALQDGGSPHPLIRIFFFLNTKKHFCIGV